MRSSAAATGTMVMVVLREASRQSPTARCSLISLCGDKRCKGSTSKAGMTWGRGKSDVTNRSKNVSTSSAKASASLLPSTTTIRVRSVACHNRTRYSALAVVVSPDSEP